MVEYIADAGFENTNPKVKEIHERFLATFVVPKKQPRDSKDQPRVDSKDQPRADSKDQPRVDSKDQQRVVIVGGIPYRCGNIRGSIHVVNGRIALELFAGVSLWEGNRPVNDNRVQDMVKSQRKALEETGAYDFMQPFIVGNTDKGARLIDGQHRLRTLSRLREPERAECPIMLFECKDETGIKKIFAHANMGTPVPPVYYDDGIRELTDEYCGKLQARYQCEDFGYRPGYSKISVVEKLSGVPGFKTAVFENRLKAEDLIKATLELNRETRAAALEGRLSKDYYNMRDKKKCEKKADDTGFYLGLRGSSKNNPDWPYLVGIRMFENLDRATREELELEEREKAVPVVVEVSNESTDTSTSINGAGAAPNQVKPSKK